MLVCTMVKAMVSASRRTAEKPWLGSRQFTIASARNVKKMHKRPSPRMMGWANEAAFDSRREEEERKAQRREPAPHPGT